jgi:hypothetical protein
MGSSGLSVGTSDFSCSHSLPVVNEFAMSLFAAFAKLARRLGMGWECIAADFHYWIWCKGDTRPRSW